MKPRVYYASIRQGGLEVAYVESSEEHEVRKAAAHYALMYGQDGPVSIRYGVLGGSKA